MQTQISQQQLFDRWDSLPMSLREAIVSDVNSEIVWKTAEVEHLPEEKCKIVSRLAGYVLSGFLHPEDLADEIKNELGINPNIANSIAGAINARIFSPLRVELDKIYAPATAEPAAASAAPKTLEEIKKPVPSPTVGAPPTPASSPAVSPRIEPLRVEVGKTAPAPAPLGDVPATKPKEVAPSAIPTPVPAPANIFGPKIPPAPLTPERPGSLPKQAEEKAGSPVPLPSAMQTAKDQISSPSSGADQSVPAPVILHEESQFAPVQRNAGFKIELPEKKLSETATGGLPPRPARIEMGSAGSPQVGQFPQSKPAPAPAKTELPRVVHYTEFRTPAASQAVWGKDQAAEPPRPPVDQASNVVGQAPSVMGQRLDVPLPPKPFVPAPIGPAKPQPPSPPQAGSRRIGALPEGLASLPILFNESNANSSEQPPLPPEKAKAESKQDSFLRRFLGKLKPEEELPKG